MGINYCCQKANQEKNAEITSECKRAGVSSNFAIVKKNIQPSPDNEKLTNREAIHTVKHIKPLSNLSYTPIEADDYPAILFQILNKFRARPDLYESEASKYELKSFFDEVCRNEERPYLPEWSIDKNKMLHAYISNPQNNDKTSSEKEKEILEMYEGNANGLYFQSIGPINNLEENIWSLFENNTDDINTILTHNFQTIIIASVPIEGTDKLHTSYVFLLSGNSFKLL